VQQEVQALPAVGIVQQVTKQQGLASAPQEVQVLPTVGSLQQQGQAPAQQEVRVLHVLTTGSEVVETSSSATPERVLPVRQQQKPGTDADDGDGGDDGSERVAEVSCMQQSGSG
jgi:hypothetical protein